MNYQLPTKNKIYDMNLDFFINKNYKLFVFNYNKMSGEPISWVFAFSFLRLFYFFVACYNEKV
jgi:hypothetical protein